MDNGITTVGFLTTAGIGLVVELGVSLDVLFAVLVLGVLTGWMQAAFGDTDLDELRELHDGCPPPSCPPPCWAHSCSWLLSCCLCSPPRSTWSQAGARERYGSA